MIYILKQLMHNSINQINNNTINYKLFKQYTLRNTRFSIPNLHYRLYIQVNIIQSNNVKDE